MGRGSNQMVTFVDLQWLVDNSNFKVKNSFPETSKKACTKTECSDALHLNESAAEWIAWGSNRLIPFRLLISSTATYVGAGAYCIQDNAPTDNPPTAPTLSITETLQTSISLSWTASTDDNSVSGYHIQMSTDNSNWNTPISTGTTRTYTFTGLSASTLYYFRVYAEDSFPQYGPYSNVVSDTTDAAPPSSVALDMYVYDTNDSSDYQRINVRAPSGDTVVIQITVTSGTTGSCSKKWKYTQYYPQSQTFIDGATFPSLPQTFQFTVTGTGSYTGCAGAAAYRSGGQVGFEATTVATAKILSTTGVDANNRVGVALPMNINASGAAGC